MKRNGRALSTSKHSHRAMGARHRARRRGRGTARAHDLGAHAARDRAGTEPSSAGAVRSPDPRRRTPDRLPVLPRHGRPRGGGGPSRNPDLSSMPQRSLALCPPVPSRPPQPRLGPPDTLAARPPSARFRVLQPCRPRRRRRGVRDLPRQGGPDGDGAPGGAAHDELVRGLPPGPGAAAPAGRGDHRDGMARRAEPRAARAALTAAASPAHHLYRLPPMTPC